MIKEALRKWLGIAELDARSDRMTARVNELQDSCDARYMATNLVVHKIAAHVRCGLNRTKS